MISKTILIGHLTKDPKIDDNDKWAALSIATNESYKKDDEWVEKATFHNAFARGYNVAKAKKMKKGERVYVEGVYNNNKNEEKKFEMFMNINTLRSLAQKQKEEEKQEDKESAPDDLPF